MPAHLQPQEQVLGLDVPVDDVARVAVLQSIRQLLDVRRRPLLVELAAPLQLLH